MFFFNLTQKVFYRAYANSIDTFKGQNVNVEFWQEAEI